MPLLLSENKGLLGLAAVCIYRETKRNQIYVILRIVIQLTFTDVLYEQLINFKELDLSRFSIHHFVCWTYLL